MMLTGIADWLRAAGLSVEEVAGWQSRGHGELRNDAANMVVVDHHTAGGPFGRAPSLSTCLYGVPGVPGPLCNVLQTREADGNDVFIVIAAGTSYNAGTGGYAGVSGNWSTVGIECEHTGVEVYPANRAALTQRFNAAVLNGLGHSDGARTCQHFEWSTAGKIDIAQGVNPDEWRRRTTEFMRGGAPGPTPTRRVNPKMWIALIRDVNWCDVYYNGVLVDAFANTGGAFGIGDKMKRYVDGGAAYTIFANEAEYAPTRKRLLTAAS